MSTKVRFRVDYMNFKKGSWATVTDRFAAQLLAEKRIYDAKDKEDKEAKNRETK